MSKMKRLGSGIKKEVYEVDEKFPCGEHADKSIIILQNFIRLEPEEILAIRAHMGGWDTAVKVVTLSLVRFLSVANWRSCCILPTWERHI